MRLDVRTVRGEPFDDVFVTATADDPRELVEGIASALRREGAAPFIEKLYAPLACRGAVLEGRASSPMAFVASDRELCTQVWAVRARGRHEVVVTDEVLGGIAGRRLVSGELSMLWLAAIPAHRDGTPERGVERMFERAEQALLEAGFRVPDIARTWIYARRLRERYSELNRARTRFYAARGIGDGGRPYPASTGIQGRMGDEDCFLELLAARSAAGPIHEPVLATDRQGPPADYGISFSRGAVLRLGVRERIFVSGTASIGSDGASRHLGDHDAQVAETLSCVAALLESRGATLRDVVAGTLYFADAAGLAAYERLARRLCLPELPLARLRADVCRPELLVEIEAIAAPQRGATP